MRVNPWVNSHTDQIILNGDKDLDAKRPLEICKWECVPDYADFFNVDKWTFRIDQEEIPTWADPSMMEMDAREYVKHMLDDCPDTTNGIKILDGRIVALRGNGVVGKLTECSILVYAGSCQIKNAGSCQIEHAGSCQIEYAGNCQIGDAGNCRIEDTGNCQIEYAGSCQIEYAGYSLIKHAGNCQIKDAGSSQIKYAGSCRIEDAADATIDGVKHKNGKPIPTAPSDPETQAE